MLTKAFHAWERRLASVSEDRVVRPFEWGLEWIGDNGHPIIGEPEAILSGWIDRVMADTDRFFDTPPTSAYRFVPAANAPSSGSPLGTLAFESAFATPHAENNTVYAQYFPSLLRRGTRRSLEQRRAVLVLPQWNADSKGHVGLCRLLTRFGMSALRLSLPYHEQRMPPHLTRADYIVSANVARTVQVCRQAVLDARRAIGWLANQGYERIGILGTSLGSCLAMLTTAHEPRIRVQALNHISPFFADVVWAGLSTAHVRAGFDGHIDLDRLRSLWRPISPQSYLERVGDRQTLLVYARYDLTFPVELSRALVNEFRRHRIPHRLAVLPCGHYTTGVAPFKYVDGLVLARFLSRYL